MWRKTLGCISIVALSGCTYFKNEQAAPVVGIGEYHTITQGSHVVAKGETLYEIAWRYGRDYRDIALENQIAHPFTIYPGQRLSLKKPKHPPSVYAKQRVELPKPVQQHQARTVQKEVNKQLPVNPNKEAFTSQWLWPVQGKIIKSFSAQSVGPKGIDISGKLGTPIKSAESGKVVYCGQGLRGYGQLVIVKHNDMYLSAYGHNSEILVKEGQAVSKGQIIAKMGSDAQVVKLHFEIRKNGQPINPITLLPPYAA